MTIPAILMVTDYRNLQHKCPYRLLPHIFYGNTDPPTRLTQIHHFYFLQIIKMCAGPDGNPTWRVTFVEFVVGKEINVTDGRFSRELDVDQMWQLSVGLPVGLG